MDRTDFRIIKVNYSNGTSLYYIQKKCRLLGFGPKIWQTYQQKDITLETDDVPWIIIGYGWLSPDPVMFNTIAEAEHFINNELEQYNNRVTVTSKEVV